MFPDLRHGTDCRIKLLLSVSALAVAMVNGACSSDLGCEQTATCPPSEDARSGPDTVDAPDGGSPDVSEDVDASDARGASDASMDQRADDRVDASDAGIADRSVGSDSPISVDAADADRTIDTATEVVVDASTDPQDDTPTCNVDAGRSPTDNPCIVSERYGIFVSPAGSDATGDGTRRAPFRTINRGLQAAKSETKRVFACDNGAGFDDPVTIDATLDGLALYGGFECSGWTLVPDQRTRVHPATGSAVSISSLASGVTFENFELRAADAATGASSIAVHVQSSSQVLFRNCRIVAGRGGPGRAGADGMAGQPGEPVGSNQLGKNASCTPPISTQSGGIAVASACGSKGGNGGTCDNVLGSLPGESGTPDTGVDPPNRANGGTHWLSDRSGRRGSDGIAGASGATSTQLGTFSTAGYTPASPGGDGAEGHVAQGGGGGSAGEPDWSNWCIGASGGGGGMGGCGGKPGTGGGAGGASVAVLSWTSVITLDHCEIASSDGGNGGNGGNGGMGGIGSAGAEGGEGIFDPDAGASLAAAGTGGSGGNGGPGGGGAGGNGGPTHAIVYAGTRPSQIGGTMVTRGAGGPKGIGGITGFSGLPDGGVGDASPDGASPPDAGVVRAPDGLPGEASYELAIP